MPKRYWLWWSRAHVMEIDQTSIEVWSSENNKEHRGAIVVKAIDIDTVGPDDTFIKGQTKTFDLILFKTPHESRIKPGDHISVFGHALKEGQDFQGSVPRYMLNHNSGMFHIAYVDMINDGTGNLVKPIRNSKQRKNWLSCEPMEKRVLNPWALLILLFLQPLFYYFYFMFKTIGFVEDTIIKNKLMGVSLKQESLVFVIATILITGLFLFPLYYLFQRFALKYQSRDLKPVYEATAGAISDFIPHPADPDFGSDYRGL